jgi:hypothetical protein
MDKKFNDKLDSISAWTKEDAAHDISDFSLSYSEQEDGLVLLSASKGSFEYRMLPLQELFTPGRSGSAVIKWDEPRYLNLLHAIESSIKRLYIEDAELTDVSVLLALDKLAIKPETWANDAVIRRINRDLRMMLSMSDYSRDEVKSAVRKILVSVKRHNSLAGARGYLDFIMEHVP